MKLIDSPGRGDVKLWTSLWRINLSSASWDRTSDRITQSVLNSTKLLAPWCIRTHTHTHTHTHILQGTNDTRDWCNRWKWVIWIRLDYGVEEVRRKKKRERERRWKRVGSKSSSLRGKNNYISLTPGASECTSVCRRHDSKTSVRM